jgi:hypothetical protein
MSRRALTLKIAPKSAPAAGNVELGMVFRLRGTYSIVDFASELVHVPGSALKLNERQFPDAERNYALAIDAATHDPAAHTLHVKWSDEAADLPPWRLA